jgi:protein MpaA
MTGRRSGGAVASVLLAFATVLGFGPSPAAAAERVVIGESVDGRPIVARQVGDPQAPVQLVIVGQLHGNEPGGRKVVGRLADAQVPPGVGMWLIRSINPDGDRAGTRTNARGVDLNRNFPQDWRRQARGTSMWSGPRAASEPETRAVVRFLRQVRPTAVLGYHQAYDVVDITHRRSREAGRRLAAWMGERAQVVPCNGPCRGTMTQWVDAHLGAIALTVELDDGVSTGEARRAAAAVLRLATWFGR